MLYCMVYNIEKIMNCALTYNVDWYQVSGQLNGARDSDGPSPVGDNGHVRNGDHRDVIVG